MEQPQYQTPRDTDFIDITDKAEAGVATCIEYIEIFRGVMLKGWLSAWGTV